MASIIHRAVRGVLARRVGELLLGVTAFSRRVFFQVESPWLAQSP